MTTLMMALLRLHCGVLQKQNWCFRTSPTLHHLLPLSNQVLYTKQQSTCTHTASQQRCTLTLHRPFTTGKRYLHALCAHLVCRKPSSPLGRNINRTMTMAGTGIARLSPHTECKWLSSSHCRGQRFFVHHRWADGGLSVQVPLCSALRGARHVTVRKEQSTTMTNTQRGGKKV